MITLYNGKETQFNNLGIAVLDDIVTNYTVERKINEYYKTNITVMADMLEKYKLIEDEMIITLPTPSGIQPFRVVEIYQYNDYEIEVFARHVFYDLQRRTVLRCKVDEGNGGVSLNKFKNSLDKEVPHHFTSNIATKTSFDWVRKKGVDILLGSDDNSFINKYGGELDVNGFNVSINTRIGKNRGFKVLYRKNVTGFNGKTSFENVITRIIPVGYDGITLENNGFIDSPLVNNYDEVYSDVIKFDNIKWKNSGRNESEDGFETLEEAQDALRQACYDYFQSTECDKPTSTFTINFLMLKDTEEYKDTAILEELQIGDDVQVDYKPFNILLNKRMIAYNWDGKTGTYNSIQLGEGENSFFADINNKFDDYAKKEELEDKAQQILDQAFKEVNDYISSGGNGSYIKFLPNIMNPREIIACDDEDLYKAVNVLRINKNGLGLSSTGFNGEYQGITTNGKLAINELTTNLITANLIRGGAISSILGNLVINLDDDYLEVTHGVGDTKTRIDEEGFYILDESNEIIASLASKESWSELRADKVFAKNIKNIYTGDSNVHVNYSWTGECEGTSNKPFNCFQQMVNHLNDKIINTTVNVYINGSGNIYDRFLLKGINGSGKINFVISKDLIFTGNNTPQEGFFEFKNITIPIKINGGRTSYNTDNGCIVRDNYYGITFENCTYFEVELININCEYGVAAFYSKGYTRRIDFCSSLTGLYASNSSIVYDADSCGNCTNAYYSVSGSIITIGNSSSGGIRPVGTLYKHSGDIISITDRSASNSYRTKPTVPPIFEKIKTFNFTSLATYQYAWSNWKVGECKQGAWDNGQRGGHIFLDIASIRSFLSGTVQDGNTITLTRRNAGGNSGATNVYVSGSNCSSASGTPNYSNKTLIGTLSWGQTSTFTLPKAIVESLKNGTCNSIAFYSGVGNRVDYIEITSCSINLKVNK